MIKLDNGQWCYSPYLPEAYKHTRIYKVYGADLAWWNIIYLTYPEEMEGSRTGTITSKQALDVFSTEVIGSVCAATSSELKQFDADFGLRDLVTKPLPLFIYTLPSIEMRATPAAKLFDGKWVERVLANAKKIYEAHCDEADEVSVIDPALTDVIIRKFGR